MEDDYGLSTLERFKKQEEIPTFGKKQSEELVMVAATSQKVISPFSARRKNYIELNKKFSSRTELNINGVHSKKKSRTEYVSP
jgi:hypothetical protein